MGGTSNNMFLVCCSTTIFQKKLAMYIDQGEMKLRNKIGKIISELEG